MLTNNYENKQTPTTRNQPVASSLPISETLLASSLAWQKRALAAEKKLESLELVIICATDIVNAWSKLTFRGLGIMTKSIDTLKQALNESKAL